MKLINYSLENLQQLQLIITINRIYLYTLKNLHQNIILFGSFVKKVNIDIKQRLCQVNVCAMKCSQSL